MGEMFHRMPEENLNSYLGNGDSHLSLLEQEIRDYNPLNSAVRPLKTKMMQLESDNRDLLMTVKFVEFKFVELQKINNKYEQELVGLKKEISDCRVAHAEERGMLLGKMEGMMMKFAAGGGKCLSTVSHSEAQTTGTESGLADKHVTPVNVATQNESSHGSAQADDGRKKQLELDYIREKAKLSDSLAAELDDAHARAQKMEKQLQASEKLVQDLRAALAGGLDEKKRLVEGINILERKMKEAEKLKDYVSQLEQKSFSSGEEKRKAEEEVRDMRNELDEQIAEYKSGKEQVEEELARVNMNVTKLTNELASVNQTLTEKTKKNQCLMSKLTSLTSQVEKDRQSWKQKLEKLQKANKVLKAEKEAVIKSTKDASDAEMAEKILQLQNESATKILLLQDEHARAIGELESKNKLISADMASYKTAAEEQMENLRNELAEKKQQLEAELRQKGEGMQALQTKERDLMMDVQRLKRELDDTKKQHASEIHTMKTRFEGAQSELMIVKSKSTASVAELTASLHELEKDRKLMKQDISNITDELQAEKSRFNAEQEARQQAESQQKAALVELTKSLEEKQALQTDLRLARESWDTERKEMRRQIAELQMLQRTGCTEDVQRCAPDAGRLLSDEPYTASSVSVVESKQEGTLVPVVTVDQPCNTTDPKDHAVQEQPNRDQLATTKPENNDGSCAYADESFADDVSCSLAESSNDSKSDSSSEDSSSTSGSGDDVSEKTKASEPSVQGSQQTGSTRNACGVNAGSEGKDVESVLPSATIPCAASANQFYCTGNESEEDGEVCDESLVEESIVEDVSADNSKKDDDESIAVMLDLKAQPTVSMYDDANDVPKSPSAQDVHRSVDNGEECSVASNHSISGGEGEGSGDGDSFWDDFPTSARKGNKVNLVHGLNEFNIRQQKSVVDIFGDASEASKSSDHDVSPKSKSSMKRSPRTSPAASPVASPAASPVASPKSSRTDSRKSSLRTSPRSSIEKLSTPSVSRKNLSSVKPLRDASSKPTEPQSTLSRRSRPDANAAVSPHKRSVVSPKSSPKASPVSSLTDARKSPVTSPKRSSESLGRPSPKSSGEPAKSASATSTKKSSVSKSKNGSKSSTLSSLSDLPPLKSSNDQKRSKQHKKTKSDGAEKVEKKITAADIFGERCIDENDDDLELNDVNIDDIFAAL